MNEIVTERSKEKSNVAVVAILCLLVGGLGGYFVSHSSAAPKAAVVDDEHIKDVVDKYIIDNPETLVRSLQSLSKGDAQGKANEANPASSGSATVKEKHAELFQDANSPFVGKADSTAVVVEFFDYHCGYCKHMFPNIKKLLADNPNAKVIFKELPILSPDSRTAAQAALAVHKIDPTKYFAFHEALMQYSDAFDIAALKKIASDNGIDPNAMEKEMAADWVATELTHVSTLAQSLGVQGTPALVIGQDMIPGAIDYDQLKLRVKAAEGMSGKN